MNFYDMLISLHITRAEEHKRERLTVEEGVCLALEARQRAEEEKEHIWLDSEEEARLIEETRLKSEEEGQDC